MFIFYYFLELHCIKKNKEVSLVHWFIHLFSTALFYTFAIYKKRVTLKVCNDLEKCPGKTGLDSKAENYCSWMLELSFFRWTEPYQGCKPSCWAWWWWDDQDYLGKDQGKSMIFVADWYIGITFPLSVKLCMPAIGGDMCPTDHSSL